MDFNDSRLLDSLCYDLVLGDYPRGINRSYIADIANGVPPYSDQEVEDNGIEVNVNDLTHTRLCHEGRAQLFNGFMKTGNNIRFSTDFGPVHKRQARSALVTKEINRPLRRSIKYFERQRSKFGQLILHGIAPGVWQSEDDWCATPLGVEDALIPSNTLLGFENLPVYVLRRQFTGIELQKLTQKSKRDPGWNMPMVDRVMKWIDSQMTQLRSTNWPEIWAPEKVSERIKQDGGYYMGDQVPTIDCFDVYGYQDGEEDGTGKSGWVRRIILDSWGAPAQSGITSSGKVQYSMGRKADEFWKNDKNYGFLYTSRKRKVADSWNNTVAYQFADLSAVFPARYHSIRSLGWLIYAPCHLGNRMRCKFYEAVFETLTMLFRIKDSTDAQRALKLDLINRGFIDDTINPVPAGERWQVNQALVEMGMRDNAQIISDNSSSFVQNQDYSQQRTEKTKFQVQAEVNAVTSLVGAALNQAYQYEAFEDREILRRFFRKNSKNPDVRQARARILRADPDIEKYLHTDCWDAEHERVMGGGNKTMETQIAEWLMQNRDKYDPDAQRVILRDATLAVTDNPDKAQQLVPEQPKASDSVHDAQLAASTLLMGLPMELKQGVNHQEYAAALLGAMQNQIQKISQRGGVPTPDEFSGLQNLAGQTVQGQPIKGNGVMPHIQLLEADKQSVQVAKKLNDFFSKQMNLVRQLGQHLQEAMKKQQQQQAEQNGNGHMDPKDMAKIQAMQMQSEVKAKNAERSNAQRTSQRQIDWEQKMQQQREEHAVKMDQEHRQHVADLAATDLEAASNVRRNRLKTTEE